MEFVTLFLFVCVLLIKMTRTYIYIILLHRPSFIKQACFVLSYLVFETDSSVYQHIWAQGYKSEFGNQSPNLNHLIG
jgi:hypothetical protein